MKNTFKYIIALTVLAAAIRCHYLDKQPESEGYTPDQVFGDSLRYRQYCEQLVELPPFEHLFNPGVPTAPQGSYDCVSDNSMNEAPGNTAPCRVTATGNFYGLMNSSTATMASNTTWDKMWHNVRIANNGIRNIHLFNGGTAERDKILGMCYFFRAYLYMDICRRWGGMPYMWKPVVDGAQNMDLPRLSMQQTFKYAAIDCDSAAMYLKNTIPASEFQHPTRVAALVLKSRCLLYAASKQAADETGTAAEDLWADAAMAADAAIRAAEDESNGEYGLVDGDNYYYLFKGEDEGYYRREVLFGRRSSKPWANNAYRNNCGRPPGQLGGNFGTAPNWALVESYDMAATGLPTSDHASQYDLQNPFAGRDKRFYHDIVFNGTSVMGKTINIWNRDATAPEGTFGVVGGDTSLKYTGNTIDPGYTETGTYAGKWLGKDFNEPLSCIWSYIRLSEVYLNFAEAANEMWGTPGAIPAGCKYSPKDALDKVRTRAGVAVLPAKFVNREAFRERTRNERRVEFSFEEHRIFDIRRWMIAGEAQFRDIYGVYITKLEPGTYNTATYPTGFMYERTDKPVLIRIHEARNYLWPIKVEDTQLGPNFNQNPGW